jgi:hypothetical protein
MRAMLLITYALVISTTGCGRNFATTTLSSTSVLSPAQWSGIANLSPASAMSAIQGTWQSACNGTEIQRYTFSGTTMTQTMTDYNGYGCTGGLSAAPVVTSLTVTIEGISSTQPEGYDLHAPAAANGYQIIKFTQTQLALGKSVDLGQPLDGSSAGRRPVEWSLVTLIKQ